MTITGTVAQINDAAEHQRHQHGQLRRQHRHAERELDADADGARQRQHRYWRRAVVERHGHDQHHGGERRAGGDDHADELRGDRADQPHLKNTGLSISDVDAGSGSMSVTLAVTEGTLNVAAGHQRRVSPTPAPRR